MGRLANNARDGAIRDRVRRRGGDSITSTPCVLVVGWEISKVPKRLRAPCLRREAPQHRHRLERIAGWVVAERAEPVERAPLVVSLTSCLKFLEALNQRLKIGPASKN